MKTVIIIIYYYYIAGTDLLGRQGNYIEFIFLSDAFQTNRMTGCRYLPTRCRFKFHYHEQLFIK